MQSGEQLDFDYAILCTGSSYPAGIKPAVDRLTDRAARIKQFSDVAEKVGAAVAYAGKTRCGLCCAVLCCDGGGRADVG